MDKPIQSFCFSCIKYHDSTCVSSEKKIQASGVIFLNQCDECQRFQIGHLLFLFCVENISKTSSENKVPWLSRDNLKKTSTPLQENNDNLHSNNEEGRQRLSSVESNGDIDHRSRERTPSKNGIHQALSFLK